MQLGQTNFVPIKAIFTSTYFELCHRRTVDLDFDVRGCLKRLFCKMLNFDESPTINNLNASMQQIINNSNNKIFYLV